MNFLELVKNRYSCRAYKSLRTSRWDRYLGMTAAMTQISVPTATATMLMASCMFYMGLFLFFLPLMRHLCQDSDSLLQNTPMCRNKSERNAGDCLETDGIIPNFAA